MAVKIIDHPLVQHKVTLLRDKDTGSKDFRELVSEIASFMAYEATRDVELNEIDVKTPISETKGKTLRDKLALVPILRAGLGMLGGIERLIPNAKIGHIGMYRNEENLLPVEYFCKMPSDLTERKIFLLDPMLATGHSAAAAVEALLKRGVKIESIKFLCLVAAPEGIAHLEKIYPELVIYTTSIDDHLNNKGYIVPGLGDAGDRIFGTL